MADHQDLTRNTATNIVGAEDIELREANERRSLTQDVSPNQSSPVEGAQVQQKTSFQVVQPQQHEEQPATQQNAEAEVEPTNDTFKVKIVKKFKSFVTKVRFFIHHKNKVDKRNYYCGYTCHGWGTMLVYYLCFYAFLIGFFVGLYFLAYYIMPFPQEAQLWQPPPAPTAAPSSLIDGVETISKVAQQTANELLQR
jgi:hypothetical protein